MKTRILKTVLTVLTFVVILAAASIYAVDQSNRYYAYGVGQQSCEDYVKLREKKLDMLEQQHERYTKDELYDMADKAVEYWIAGFLTAHDLYVADTFNIAGDTNMDDLKGRLENICRSNGKQHFAEAMFTMVQQLHPQRVKAHTGK
jgi:hypothetical protein